MTIEEFLKSKGVKPKDHLIRVNHEMVYPNYVLRDGDYVLAHPLKDGGNKQWRFNVEKDC